MKNITQILFAVNRDMGILKKLVKAQAKLIDFLMSVAYSPYCELGDDGQKEIDKLMADIKEVADQAKKKK